MLYIICKEWINEPLIQGGRGNGQGKCGGSYRGYNGQGWGQGHDQGIFYYFTCW